MQTTAAQSRPMTSQFAYPTNEAGQPEYQSVIITLDHLSAGTDANPHIHNKFVFSTQDELEAMYALFGYYGESERALNASVQRNLVALYSEDFPVLVYQTASNTELVLAMDAFLEAINNAKIGNGSILQAVDFIVRLYGQIVTERLGDLPAGSRLSPFGFTLDMVDAPEGEGNFPVDDTQQA